MSDRSFNGNRNPGGITGNSSIKNESISRNCCLAVQFFHRHKAIQKTSLFRKLALCYFYTTRRPFSKKFVLASIDVYSQKSINTPIYSTCTDFFLENHLFLFPPLTFTPCRTYVRTSSSVYIKRCREKMA